MDNNIDPNVWTQKELVKHLYREVKKIATKLDTFGEKIDYLEQESKKAEIINEVEKKRRKANLGIASLIGGFIAFIINIVFEIFAKK
jgi:hypothetical protein